MGSRDKNRGDEAVKKLGLPNVKLLLVDLDSEDSIASAAATVKNDYGGEHLLIF